MIRYAKPFGTMVLAAFLLVAVGAAPASALKEIRTAEAPRIITGAQNAEAPFVFKGAAGEMKCTTASIEGTMLKTDQPSLKVVPVFSGCSVAGFKADVTTTGCSFVYTYEEIVVKTEKTGDTHTPGPMHIVCDAGKQILVTPTFLGASVCTLEVPAQTPTEPEVDHKVHGMPSEVMVTYKVKQLQYTVKGGGATCGGEGLHKDGAFSGAQDAKGYESNAGKEGAQVAIWIN
jgi:hypothetical protein